MPTYVEVKVDWVPAEKGGRSLLPEGLKYSTVSRFSEDGADWHKSAWSVVLEFRRPPSQENPSYGRAHFLVDEAPIERLYPGRSFELYEGAKKVADVSVLEL